jgi:hypothetical protein
MLLVLIRIIMVVVGTLLFLPAFVLVPNAIGERVWEAALLAFVVGVLGAWMISAGWFGTLSGQPRKNNTSPSTRLPNTR